MRRGKASDGDAASEPPLHSVGQTARFSSARHLGRQGGRQVSLGIIIISAAREIVLYLSKFELIHTIYVTGLCCSDSRELSLVSWTTVSVQSIFFHRVDTDRLRPFIFKRGGDWKVLVMFCQFSNSPGVLAFFRDDASSTWSFRF